MNTLLSYQKEPADNMAVSVAQHRVVLGAGDPGTGKTYVACSVAARFDNPVVIATTGAPSKMLKRIK